MQRPPLEILRPPLACLISSVLTVQNIVYFFLPVLSSEILLYLASSQGKLGEWNSVCSIMFNFFQFTVINPCNVAEAIGRAGDPL